MKSLHVCNLANVAYGYCKILKASGYDVKLVCHDINHVMSQPEWDDQDLELDLFPDENNFFNSRVPLRLTRPEWYIRSDISYYSRPHVRLLSQILPRTLKEFIRPIYYKLAYGSDSVKPPPSALTSRPKASDYSYADALKFVPNRDWLGGLTGDEDVIFAYVMTPIYTLLSHDRPYIAVEIGTMRDIPLEDSANGRMLRAAYCQADFVLITNPDVRKQADLLGLKRYAFCPHPVDESKFIPTYSQQLKFDLLNELPETELIGIAPARQNWALKGNFKYLESLRELRFEHNAKVSLIIPTWGQDIQQSKDYAKKLQVDQFIKWMPPVSEKTLIKMYGTLDFVLDQFQLGVFGLITPKALSCGAAVITSYDRGVHEWCFREHPPLLAANTATEITNRILSLFDKELRKETSIKARDWFIRNHSTAIVKNILLNAAREAQAAFARK